MGRSGSKTEELIDQTDFACRSGLAEDTVTAADHAHDLKALQGRGGGFHLLEPGGWPDHALERSMISLDDIVQIIRCPMLDIFREQPLALQALDCSRIRR